jgi:hypothetical protein
MQENLSDQNFGQKANPESVQEDMSAEEIKRMDNLERVITLLFRFDDEQLLPNSIKNQDVERLIIQLEKSNNGVKIGRLFFDDIIASDDPFSMQNPAYNSYQTQMQNLMIYIGVHHTTHLEVTIDLDYVDPEYREFLE